MRRHEQAAEPLAVHVAPAGPGGNELVGVHGVEQTAHPEATDPLQQRRVATSGNRPTGRSNRTSAGTLGETSGQALLRAVVAEAMVTPEVADALHRFWQERYALTSSVVERAVERGELPAEAVPRVVLELLIGPLYLRSLVTLDPIDDEFLGDHAARVARLARAGRGVDDAG